MDIRNNRMMKNTQIKMESIKDKKVKSRVIYNIIMILICLIISFPFFWMVLSSFKTGQEIIQVPPTFFPKNFTLENYKIIFEKLNFSRFILNSLIVTIISTIAAMFTSSLAGYVFAKFNFKGKNIIFILCISGLMIPFAAIIMPMYIIISTFGLRNSYLGLILPFIVNPFGIFLIRQFIETIPNELIEAARMDGANEFIIYLKVILPNIGSVVGAVGIFNFLLVWNNLLWPLIIISKESMNTLPLGIATLGYTVGTRYDMIVTGATISVIPVMIVFALAQRQIVSGVTFTGIKA